MRSTKRGMVPPMKRGLSIYPQAPTCSSRSRRCLTDASGFETLRAFSSSKARTRCRPESAARPVPCAEAIRLLADASWCEWRQSIAPITATLERRRPTRGSSRRGRCIFRACRLAARSFDRQDRRRQRVEVTRYSTINTRSRHWQYRDWPFASGRCARRARISSRSGHPSG